MEAFLASLALVAAAEIGDKSQLLALALAVRFRRPRSVAAGIALAAFASHALAGVLGVWLSQALPPAMQAWIIGGAFLLMGLWLLIPEREEGDADREVPRHSVRSAMLTTAALFFVAELGDKTQLATVALSAGFQAPLPVILGAALGMTAINLPVIWLGHRFARRLPVRPVRLLGAILFVALGIGTLIWR